MYTQNSIVFTDYASRDLDISINHYKNISNQVALKFIFDIKRATDLLLFMPEIGSIKFENILKHKSIRFWNLKHYPYLFIYTYSKNTITVLRVLHTQMDIPHHLRNEI